MYRLDVGCRHPHTSAVFDLEGEPEWTRSLSMCPTLRGFNTVLGVAAVAAGLGSFFGIDLSFLAILLFLWGAQILLRELIAKRGSQERAK